MLPSASKLHLAMTCAASAVYSRTDRLSQEADTGKDIHLFLRLLSSMSREEALDRVPEASRARCEAIDVTGLPIGPDWKAEAAYAYDVETEAVRFLGYDIGRDYGAPQTPSEMFLSIDTSAVVDGVAFVADWKTGRGRLPPAKQNWQLRVAALVVARHSGAEVARGALIRIGEDGLPHLDIAEWDDFELACFASELRALHARLQAPEAVVPVVGEHCKHCPAFEACPAQGRLIARLASNPEEEAAQAVLDLTPDTAWRAYERLKAIETVAKRVREALYLYAQQTPIPLPGGHVFGMVEVEREEFDAVVVRNVLAALYGVPVAEKACDFETSKAGIERGLRLVYEERKRQGQKATLKALKEEALQAVREAGGVSLKTKREVKEHRAPTLPEDAGEQEEFEALVRPAATDAA
jgi:hypothetical protein